MSVTAVDLVEFGGMPEGPVPAGESFLDRLVARLSAQYGLDPRAVRSRAVQVLASFAGARVRAFVSILVRSGCATHAAGPAAWERSRRRTRSLLRSWGTRDRIGGMLSP